MSLLTCSTAELPKSLPFSLWSNKYLINFILSEMIDLGLVPVLSIRRKECLLCITWE